MLAVLLLAACGGSDHATTDGGPDPDGGGPDGGDPANCAALTDEASCRADPRCVADLCLECSCDPVFEGCRAPGAPPTDCPDLDCAQPECCQSEDDCAASGFPCAPPGTPPGCGICNGDPGDCTSDAGCDPAGTGNVCDPIPCSCDGALHCTPGCVDDTTCGEATTCDTTAHRCVALPCPAGDECPANFACVAPGPTAPHCARATCASDGDCPLGFCVLGLCYDALGVCSPPVP